jgi:Glycosyltransferase family 87
MLAAAIAVSLVGAGPASAAAGKIVTVTKTVTVASSSPLLISNPAERPAGFKLTAGQAQRIAARSPVVIATLKRHPTAYPGTYTKGSAQWQVSWFTRQGKEIIQVYVDDFTRKVTEAWTGFQVAWSMARGYPGSFGHNLNHPWVWLPLCVLFLAPFIPLPRRRGGRWAWPGWSLLHLDLLMLLGFSISLAYFNNANLGLSVPLAYPFLLYLLVRMIALGLGRGRPRVQLRLNVSAYVLVVMLAALVGFRTYSNISDSGVIDVGYAGVIGADRIIHGEKLYGVWPASNPTGDTYGPVNYYAYVPFRAIFGWSGSWDSLPAGHAAAIAFDLLTLLGLFLLGRRIRGPTLGVALAYAWAAYPFTFYVLQSSSNDSLLALLLVLSLLVFSSRPARGVFLSLAAFAKFFPLALGPLFLRGTDEKFPWRPRKLIPFTLAFATAAFVVMAQVLFSGDLHRFWGDTIVRQWDRTSPFSIWGLWGGLSFEQHVVDGIAVALGLAVAWFPRRRRSLVEVAALAAAVTIAFQLGLTHWFYLYIVWFFPLVIVAVLGCEPARGSAEANEARSEDGAHLDRPAPILPTPAGPVTATPS